MFKSLPAATTVAAAIGILAATASVDQVSGIQLVADSKVGHKMVEDQDQDIQEDNTLLETRKQLDLVEEQLNQMKSETEANLEIAEEESQSSLHKHKSKGGKKHHKKSKHIKNKKVKVHKKHVKKQKSPDNVDDDEPKEDNPSTADLETEESSNTNSGLTADDDAFQSYHKKKAHHKQPHKTHKKTKRGHSSHKKIRHAPHSPRMVNHEEDPFATFEESLTNHKIHHQGQVAKHHSNLHRRGRVSHAQKKKFHKSHAHLDSVPACTSLGCAKDSAAKPPADPWPKDYPVANWGSDHDMSTTAKNMADAEGKLGAWNPKQNEDGVYEVPHVDAEFKLNSRNNKFIPNFSDGKEELAGVNSDLRMGAKSDPVCSSAGCT